MPRRSDLNSVLVIGPGPAVIGEAGELDCAALQTVRALKAEGLRVIVVSPNPATVATDPGVADATYIEPITPGVVDRILRAEKPDALLPTPGGWAALEAAAALAGTGLLARHGTRLIGADAALIRRPPPEEPVTGWKEFELVVLRDRKENAVVAGSIEKLDLIGFGTGDSIAVAPAQTLSDRELQGMRGEALAAIRAAGLEPGSSIVRFAVNPADGRQIVLGMNPCPSRGSALAGRAAGFPIAGIAARLAVGCTLDEVVNDLTRKTRAAFEPSLDCCAVLVPRPAHEIPPSVDWGPAGEIPPFADPRPAPTMIPAGGAMALGCSFSEALLKALAGLDLPGGEELRMGVGLPVERESLLEMVRRPTWRRPFEIFQALRAGIPSAGIAEAAGIDRWFVDRVEETVLLEQAVAADLAEAVRREDLETSRRLLRAAKQGGVSDWEIARLAGGIEPRDLRRRLGVLPAMAAVDPCAAEFPVRTPYLYSTYDVADEGEPPEPGDGVEPTGREAVVVLGPGPGRIGQGIELDHGCAQGCRALREEGLRVIMVNPNPEFAAADGETADRLYLEPLTVEHVLNVLEREKPLGVILQLGGPAPLRLARVLEQAGARILGAGADVIEMAGERGRLGESLELLLGNGVELAPEFPLPSDEPPGGAVRLDVDAVSDGREVLIGAIMETVGETGMHPGDAMCVVPPFSVGEHTLARVAALTRDIALRLEIVGLLNVRFRVRAEKIEVLEVTPRASRTIPFAGKAAGLPLAGLAARVMVGRKLADLRASSPAGPPVVNVRKPLLFATGPAGEGTPSGVEPLSIGEAMGRGADFGRAWAKAHLGGGGGLPVMGGVFLSVRDDDRPGIVFMARKLEEMGFSILAAPGTARFLRMNGIPAEDARAVDEPSPNVLDLIRAGRIHLAVDTSTDPVSRDNRRALGMEALARGIPVATTMAGAAAAVAGIEAMRISGIGVAPLHLADAGRGA